MEHYNIYNTILEKIDKAIEEDKAHPLLLIGGYRIGGTMYTDNSALLDEYLEGNYTELDVDPDADYSDQFEQFMKEVKTGYTFGDYQEFALLGDRLKEFREEVENRREKDENPTYIYDSKELDDITRVQCNGFKDRIDTAVCRGNEAFKELLGYLEDLNNLYVNAVE